MNIGKAHQRKIREKIARKHEKPPVSYFFNDRKSFPEADIKQAELREISRKEAESIILVYEWLGTMGITYKHYGIFFDGEIAGAICFGMFQAMAGYGNLVGEKYKDQGIQLTRGACAHWAHPHSGSKLIGFGLREVKKLGYKFVVAFSDPDAGEIGTLYQATNWHYLGVATKQTHWNLVWTHGNRAGKVYLNDRDIQKKYGFCGRKRIEDEIIGERDDIKLVPVYPKARYIKLIGSKKENKEMFSVLEPFIQPYPKRN